MNKFTIAIDGPASSGKSTVAREVAKRLKITYIDTGAMYRGVTLAILRNGIDVNDTAKVIEALDDINIDYTHVNGEQRLILNGSDVSEEIRSIEVTNNVSEISAIREVREKLVALQQLIAEKQSVVMDGRDIGTVVLPKANYKFFFIASPRVRALRRYNENLERGISTQTLEEIESAIIERDRFDSTREHSPLKQADDAILIDTSDMSIGEVASKIISRVSSSQFKIYK